MPVKLKLGTVFRTQPLVLLRYQLLPSESKAEGTRHEGCLHEVAHASWVHILWFCGQDSFPALWLLQEALLKFVRRGWAKLCRDPIATSDFGGGQI